MAHYRRNILFLSIIVLPIIGFLMGWSLNAKLNIHGEKPISLAPEQTALDTTIPEVKQTTGKKTEPRDVDLNILWETWQELEKNYLRANELDKEQQLYGAIKGLVYSAADPYTVFFTPDESQAFRDGIDGGFTGIGAEIENKDGQLVIVTPLKGSPAEGAGLVPGDIIVEIEGEPAIGMDILEAVGKIKGKEGTPVNLSIQREELDKPLPITIIREKITLKPVSWEIIEKENEEETLKYGYISITQFSSNLGNEFDNAASDVLLENPNGIILDLRNNGGGDLDACIEMARHFLRNKLVVSTNGNVALNSKNFTTDRSGVLTQIPLIVLVNEGSASASEVFAGAIQDHARGVIVGETSFGKGLVQHIISLSDGSSLKVTSAEWLTPRGRQIHGEGITPDFELPEDQVDEEIAIERAIQILEGDYLNWLEKRRQANRAFEEEKEAN